MTQFVVLYKEVSVQQKGCPMGKQLRIDIRDLKLKKLVTRLLNGEVVELHVHKRGSWRHKAITLAVTDAPARLGITHQSYPVTIGRKHRPGRLEVCMDHGWAYLTYDA
jgi:hypothetical protein